MSLPQPPIDTYTFRRHVRVGEWTVLAFLGLSLIRAFPLLMQLLRTQLTMETSLPLITSILIRTFFFLALYVYIRYRPRTAYRAGAVSLAVLSLVSVFTNFYLLAVTYLIGAYLLYRASEAIRRLPDHALTEEAEDVLDA